MNELLDIAAELGEIGIDTALDEGVLREIPILGTTIGLARASKSVRDNLLLKKIGKFFTPIAKASEKAGKDLLAKLDQDESFKKKLSELIAVYLDKYDAEIKAEYLGILLASCLNGELDHEDFLRMASMIERAYWGDLNRLTEYAAAGSEGITQSLSAVQMDGFILTSPLLLGDIGDDENRFNANFEITPLGRKLLDIVDRYRTEEDAS